MSLHKSALRSNYCHRRCRQSRDPWFVVHIAPAHCDVRQRSRNTEYRGTRTKTILSITLWVVQWLMENRSPPHPHTPAPQLFTLGGTYSLRRDDLPGPCAPRWDATAKRSARRGTNSAAPPRWVRTIPTSRSRDTEWGCRPDLAPPVPSMFEAAPSGDRANINLATSWDAVGLGSQPSHTHGTPFVGRYVGPAHSQTCSHGDEVALFTLGERVWWRVGKMREERRRKRSRRRCVSHCRNLWSNHKFCVREYYLLFLNKKKNPFC